MAIVSSKNLVAGICFLAGCIFALVGGLAISAAIASPNAIHLWSGTHVTYELKANPLSLPLGVISLLLGVFLAALSWRKRSKK